MEAIIFVGIQGSGKTSFYRNRFFRTHVRINLDMLRTRHREQLILSACIEGKMQFVVDNTNPTANERARYIVPARSAGFRVFGYYFRSAIADALRRNNERAVNERVSVKGILGTHKRLKLPNFTEGFDALHYVSLDDASNSFLVKEWKNEI